MSVPAVQCKATSKQSGKQCKNWAIRGGEVCRLHGGSAKQVASKAAVRAEVLEWGVGDPLDDPGEVLLRLVTQSRKRADLYAHLQQEAFEAAERLKKHAHEAGENIEAEGDEYADTAETARRDLDRIFNTGGVAALVGNTYGAAKDVGVYVTGEAIRGLADLEAKERNRCANFAAKAVAAGLMKRQVELAELQGQLLAKALAALPAILKKAGANDEMLQIVASELGALEATFRHAVDHVHVMPVMPGPPEDERQRGDHQE